MNRRMRQQLQKLQEELERLQAELETQTVEVSVGGGAVKVVMNGHQRLQSVTIDPELLTPEEQEMLQDLIVAAVNEAVELTQEMAARRLGPLTGGLGLPGM